MGRDTSMRGTDGGKKERDEQRDGGDLKRCPIQFETPTPKLGPWLIAATQLTHITPTQQD